MLFEFTQYVNIIFSLLSVHSKHITNRLCFKIKDLLTSKLYLQDKHLNAAMNKHFIQEYYIICIILNILTKSNFNFNLIY